MKKLKKVFLICLFSFLFIVNVNASTTELDNTISEGLYKSFFSKNSKFNRDSLLNLCDTFLSQYMNTGLQYYTCSFQVVASTAGWFSYNGEIYTPQIVINQFSNDITLGYNIGYKSFNVENYSNATIKSKRIWLTNSLSVKQADSTTNSLNSTSFYLFSNVVPNNFPLFYVIKSNLTNQYFTFYNESGYTDNFKIGDLYMGYNYRQNKLYFSDTHPKSFSEIFPSEILSDLGTFNNSNVLTYKINDEKSGTNKELKLKFTFLNQLDINANDITIYKYGSQVYTQYSGTTCSNVDNDSVCEFNLKYDVYSSNTDKLMFDFKFNNSYNVKVEDNSGSNGIYSNYKDVEFEYKLLDFSKMSGAIFYLRNYDNFEYMKDYLYNVEYNFGIWSCKDYGSFKGAITYGNDIEYKNNYIYKDVDNFYKFDNGTYIKINNLGMDSYDFIFDSSLLSDNKFPSFVIRNRNYLGSLDTDNLPLYVYYNSSLFNYNKLDFSTNVNSGSTSNYVGTNQDFNFSVNGSQNSFDVGVSSGEIFEFDEDIKVHYKSGLQYFKDKIIDMFEFVSEFYNTMPNKFQVAFSLIFVLLIGIALFRLLL